MRCTYVLSLVLLTTAGCEPDRSLGADLRSGTRLRARYWVAPSGAEVFADWYDTELEVVCSPAETADGVVRCLPASTTTGAGAMGVGGTRIDGSFADAACTERVYRWSSDCDPPSMIRLMEPDTCGSYAVVYSVTGEATPQALYGVHPETGECESLTAPPSDSRYLRLGSARPPSDFVALEPLGPSGGGRLRQQFYRGSDGSRLPRGLFDNELDTDCSPLLDAAGQLRCLPDAANAYSFADAQCQTHMVEWGRSDGSCTLPDYRFGRTGELTACTIRTTIYELGEPAEGADVFVLNPEGGCEEGGLPPGAVGTAFRWAVTAELPPETFVALDSLAPLGEGRLRLQRVADAGGFVASEQLWDEDRSETCHPSLMADGTTRCRPAYRGNVRDTYADAACTVASPSVWFQFNDCMDTDAARYAASRTDTCPQQTRIFEVGEALDGSPLYERNAQDECVQAMFPGQYALGAEIPASDFVELTLQQR